MKILFATSECAPFSKSGGLADVAFSLPPALKRAGNEVAIISPLYQCVRNGFGASLIKVKDCDVKFGSWTYEIGLYRGERDGVTAWFVDYIPFFDRPRLYGYNDDKVRFAMFSKAVIDLIYELDLDGSLLNGTKVSEEGLLYLYKNGVQVKAPKKPAKGGMPARLNKARVMRKESLGLVR